MMQKSLLLIGTTKGPVQVLAVRKEQGDPPSALFLNGTTTRLPISRDYRDFVETPSGIVERVVGHRSFRTDVSAPIDSGDSWRLGVLIAHLLAEDGALAGRGADYDHIIWTSGKIEHIPGTDFDIQIGEIDHLHEKLALSSTILLDAKQRGIPVTFALPGPNLTPEIAKIIEDLSPGSITRPYDITDLDAFVDEWRIQSAATATPTPADDPGTAPSRSEPPVEQRPTAQVTPASSSANTDHSQPPRKTSNHSQGKWIAAAAAISVFGAGAFAFSQMPNAPWSSSTPIDTIDLGSGVLPTADDTPPATTLAQPNEPMSDQPDQQVGTTIDDPVPRPVGNPVDAPSSGLLNTAALAVDPRDATTRPEPTEPAASPQALPTAPADQPAPPWTAEITLRASIFYTLPNGNCLDSANVKQLEVEIDTTTFIPLSIDGEICRGRLTVSNALDDTVRAILDRSGRAPSHRISIGPNDENYILIQSGDADATLRLEAPGSDNPPRSFSLFTTAD